MSALRQYYFERQPVIMPRRVPLRTSLIPEHQITRANSNSSALRSPAITYRGILDQNSPSETVTKYLSVEFVIENSSAVAAFVRANRLLGLLLEAVAPLKAMFGDATIKVLTLVADGEGSENLYCLIVTSGDMEEARRRLKSFDQEWWLSHAVKGAGRLNFDVELI